MRFLLVVILVLFSCNKKTVKLEVVPVPEVKTIVDEQKPLFKLGSVFEGEKSIAVERRPVIMPCYRPEVVKIVRASIRVDTVLCVDTLNMDVVVHDTVTVQKIVHSRGLAYLMVVCGFVFGFIAREILLLIVKKYK